MFGYGPMMDGWGYANGLGGWGMGVIGMLLPLVLILVVVFVMYRLFNRTQRSNHFDMHSHHEASEILAVRFARGEISEEEYQRLKNLL